ncbi:MAG: ABC transporter permease subunit [Nitriliruptorales bacterium]|nr:ABC transporter permease subunit [Nitriliruptorales bacterium]
MFRVELGKAARRWRTFVLAAVLASVPLLIVLALVLNPPPPGAADGFFTLATRSGLFAPLAALTAMQPFLLPLAAGLLAGDSIAGEASAGTLRYLLVRPVRRPVLVLQKYASVVALLALAVALVLVVGIAAGGIAFGLGPAPTLSGTTLSSSEGLVRLAGAGLYALAGVAGLAAIGLFISSLTESGPGATVATVAIAIIGQIVGAISSLEAIHPFLLNEYWLAFFELFRSPVSLDLMLDGMAVFGAYIVVFLGLAVAVMTRRDVLS